MTITIQVSNKTGIINNPVTITPIITSDIAIKNIEWLCNKPVNFSVTQDQKTLRFTPSADGQYVFTITVWDINGNRLSKTSTITVGAVTPSPSPTPTPQPQPTPTPTPAPTTGTLIFDAQRDLPELFSGQVKTYQTIGSISPNGKGLECRASGNPRIVSNADKTFSLLCDAGHGRFYGYTKNYNAKMVIECAFWNKMAAQDCSLRLRSRHNEPDPCDNRFGGYGFTPDYAGWGSKRETCHNIHDLATEGSLSPAIQTKQYFTVETSVKDESGKVRWIGTYNGQKVMDRLVARQVSEPALFDQQSYFWVRQNIDSGTGELRIKSLKIYAL